MSRARIVLFLAAPFYAVLVLIAAGFRALRGAGGRRYWQDGVATYDTLWKGAA